MNKILTIEKMSYGPAAIAHEESGRTVFVTNAVPGDVVEANITSEHDRYAEAMCTKVLTPSPLRQNTKEPELLSSIAPWSILTYAAQLDAKRANVIDALVRNGKVERLVAEEVTQEVIPSAQQQSYRNKIELAAFANDRNQFSLGFTEYKSATPIQVDSCPLAVKPLQKAPKSLQGALRYLCGNDAYSLGIYRVGIRASEQTGSVQVALWTPPSAFPRNFAAKMLEDTVSATSVVRVIAHPGSERKIKRVETLAGETTWKEQLEGLIFSVSAPSFFQVNTKQAENLIQIVLDLVQPDESLFVADLYSGVGTFSLPCAQRGAEVLAIELSGSAVQDLNQNAQANTVDIDTICDDVMRALDQAEGADVVIVDPPRSGLQKEVLEGIAEIHPAKVVYISCDPQTLGRDIARFSQLGYHLKKCCPVDMFPQTYHVETVSLFEQDL